MRFSRRPRRGRVLAPVRLQAADVRGPRHPVSRSRTRRRQAQPIRSVRITTLTCPYKRVYKRKSIMVDDISGTLRCICCPTNRRAENERRK